MSKDNLFDWGRLGDIITGRENLGLEMPVAVYRLMQCTLFDTLTEAFGKDRAEELLREAGFRAGTALAHNTLDLTSEFSDFLRCLQKVLKEYKIGILKIEKMDIKKLEFTLTVDEDLDCSGMPVYGDTVCVYDEGFISGIFEAYTKREFVVKEVDCWATGDRTCRFTVIPCKPLQTAR